VYVPGGTPWMVKAPSSPEVAKYGCGLTSTHAVIHGWMSQLRRMMSASWGGFASFVFRGGCITLKSCLPAVWPRTLCSVLSLFISTSGWPATAPCTRGW
jgi:hypothetical protein